MFDFLRKAALAATTFCILSAGAASASVVSVVINSSSVPVAGVIGIPGPIVGDNNININSVFAFDEAQNFTLTSALVIDRIAGSIASGRSIDSHFVVFDPVGSVRVSATITFSRAILGLIITTGNLSASNYLGATTGVTYLNVTETGLELSDRISFSDDFTTLRWTASNPGDHIRVITAAVPLPAGGLLLLGALGGLAALRRRKMAA